ncbi:molecular chaperone [Pseudomonas asiatica]|uniref:fimbrial biogenesis chaperone n=1 Tax=Pseudomonas asiatica TaxID=2219225 RepID=UPI002570FA0A|nr:molecular chaperone [Pseudomonas asiatica]WJD71635.1 molecular chaperone [Pseudomonas asiatica]
MKKLLTTAALAMSLSSTALAIRGTGVSHPVPGVTRMAKGRRLPSLPIAVKRPLATLPIEMRSILLPVAGSTISIAHVPLVIVPLNSMKSLANPSLFRLDPGMEQLVQIQNLPNDLPSDRESLFYFNAQEIPQAEEPGENTLNIAMRTRIKVFYRPSQLQGRPEDQAKHLQWSLRKIEGVPHLVVNNPTPYHYTFSRLELTNGKQTEKVRSMAMAIPFGEQTYKLSNTPLQTTLQLTFSTIND